MGGEIAIADGAPTPQNSSAGAALVGGGYVLAWTDWAGDADDPAVPFTARGIRAQRFQPDGTPDGPAFSVNTTTAGQQANPSVAALPDGGWLIVWDDAGGTGGIAGQRYSPDGTETGEEFLVSTENAGTQIVSVVAVLEGGGFVVAWQDSSGQGGDASSGAIKARLYDATGSAIGGELLVNGNTLGNQYGPVVTAIPRRLRHLLGDANALDGSASSVRAQTFDAAGARIGAERAINSVTAGHQSVSDVAAFDGGYTIVWTDDSGQGADSTSSSVKFARFVATTATDGDDVRTGTDGVDDLYGLGRDDALSAAAVRSAGRRRRQRLHRRWRRRRPDDGGAGNDMLDGSEGNDLLRRRRGEDVPTARRRRPNHRRGRPPSGLDVATGGAEPTDDGELRGGDRRAADERRDPAPAAAMTAGSERAPTRRSSSSGASSSSTSRSAIMPTRSAAAHLDDTIAGMAGGDILLGGGGNDLSTAAAAATRLEGGTGNDVYLVDDVGDLALEQVRRSNRHRRHHARPLRALGSTGNLAGSREARR